MNRQDFRGTIHVLPYTHADIAWVHTRDWHIDRYTRVMDEVLELFESNPDYHYYVDTWIEFVKPYLDIRPQSADRLRKYISEQRFAVCAGQFGNVRSTTIGNETFIRNMQIGARHWREFAPDVELKVHSNIDVTFGHSQMPQLLDLMGLKAYFVLRPLAALDVQGIPRTFIWQGLSGDRIIMYRDTGVGVFQEHERCGKTWDTNWEAAAEGLWNNYLSAPAKDGISNIALSVGIDDGRPERFAFTDTPAHYDEMIRIWNERENSRMQYSTPNKLIDAIQCEIDKLKVVSGVLDPTDVSYNVAVNGRVGIWWLREQADRLMVESEMIDSMAVIAGKSYFDTDIYQAEWEKLLSWTPHAVQWLFRQDWREGALTLDKLALDAEKRIKRSCNRLTDGVLPLESDGMALIGTHPGRRKEIIPLWLINSDLTRNLDRLVDANGNDVRFQVVDIPTNNAELNILAEVDTPGFGFTTLEFKWEDAPNDIGFEEGRRRLEEKYSLNDPVEIDGGNYELTNGILKLSFHGGHIVSIEKLDSGHKRSAVGNASFLEPVAYPITRNGWSSDAITDDPEPFCWETMSLDETGPLRWRITRTGKTGGFWVQQNIDLIKDDDIVRSMTQFFDPADNSDSFIAMSVPISENADFSVDIPFGIEPRDVSNIQYGISERAIPGFFWGRTWVNAVDDEDAISLVAADGDKFFRVYGSPTRLVHFMAQKTRIFRSGWESYIDTFNAGGRQTFTHMLVLGEQPSQQDRLVDLAERLRRPVRSSYAPLQMIGNEAEFLKIWPSTVRLSSAYYEHGTLVIRLIQMCAEKADVEIELPFCIERATLVDLKNDPIESDIRIEGNVINLTIPGFKIATIMVESLPA